MTRGMVRDFLFRLALDGLVPHTPGSPSPDARDVYEAAASVGLLSSIFGYLFASS